MQTWTRGTDIQVLKVRYRDGVDPTPGPDDGAYDRGRPIHSLTHWMTAGLGNRFGHGSHELFQRAAARRRLYRRCTLRQRVRCQGATQARIRRYAPDRPNSLRGVSYRPPSPITDLSRLRSCTRSELQAVPAIRSPPMPESNCTWRKLAIVKYPRPKGYINSPSPPPASRPARAVGPRYCSCIRRSPASRSSQS
jgi:hypothetical protein